MKILSDILSATAVFAAPLLLVALGGMFSERSGIINIALEGIMVVGALFSCLAYRSFDASGFGPAHPQTAVFLAVLVAAATGCAFSLLLAFASIHLKADQTIGGTALNMLAPAAAITLTWAIQGQGQSQIQIPTWTRITQASFGIEAKDTFLHRLIFKSFYLTTPLSLLLLAVSAVILYRTRFGLRLRSCGEHPQAADSVGINVYKIRYAGVAISGALGGIGGIAYSMAAGSTYQSSVAGYGFLALAVMIFGNWKPLNILGASVFFAVFKIIGSYSGSIPFMPKFEGVKSSDYIYNMLPYIVTMIVLILTSRKSRAPKAEGVPYDKGAR